MNLTSDKISVKEWWDAHHKNKDNFFLTGSRGPEVWERLHILDSIGPGKRVLNIGVGLGYCTKELTARGCLVDVLDISEVALSRVKGFVKSAWTIEQFNLKNEYDLIISNLVAQHMNNEDLLVQFKKVIPGLAPSGIFALQFAFRLGAAESSALQDEQSLLNMKKGGVCRSLEFMKELIEEAGGSVVWDKKIGIFPDYNSGWYAVHIIKNNERE